MSSSYWIDVDRNLIHSRFEDKLNVQDVVNHMSRVNADPQYHKGMNSLADFTAALLDWNYLDISSFRSFFLATQAERDYPKIAIVIVPNTVTASTLNRGAIMGEAYEARLRIKIFTTIAQALEWIEAVEY